MNPSPYPWNDCGNSCSLCHDGWGCCHSSQYCCAKPLPCPWNGFWSCPDGWGCCLASHAGWGICHSSQCGPVKTFPDSWNGFVTSCRASSSSKIWKLWGARELHVRQPLHWLWHPSCTHRPSWPSSGPARIRRSLPLFPLPLPCGGPWHNPSPMGAALPLPLDWTRCEWTDSRSGNGSWMDCALACGWLQGAWLPSPVPWPSGWNGKRSNPHCWHACDPPLCACEPAGFPGLAPNQTPSLLRDWVTSVGVPTKHSTPWCFACKSRCSCINSPPWHLLPVAECKGAGGLCRPLSRHSFGLEPKWLRRGSPTPMFQ